jgi:hypothetical protein
MTKTEATKLAIEFAKEKAQVSQGHKLRGSGNTPLILRNAIEVGLDHKTAVIYGVRFWQGLLAELEDLLSGEYEEEDCVAFTCYQTLKDTPVGDSFREAWGADIGRQGGFIHGFVSDVKDGLKEQ